MDFLTEKVDFLTFLRKGAKMQTVGYYAFDDMANIENRSNGLNLCSVASQRLPLEINCVGSFVAKSRFLTDNRGGRLDYYLLYVVAGSLELTLPTGSTVMRAGSFVLIPPKTSYRYAHVDGLELQYLWVHFTGSAVEELLSEYGLFTYPTVYTVREDGSVFRRFLTIFDAFSKQDRFRERELGTLLNRLLILLARRIASLEGDTRQLSASLCLLHSSYHTDLKIPQLAREENLSVSRYNAVFRKIMGTSPVEYLIRLRISAACDLLSTTDLSVKEVGILVGYPDPHFFSRVFRSKMGVSPREYRSLGSQEGRADEV